MRATCQIQLCFLQINLLKINAGGSIWKDIYLNFYYI